MITCPSHQCTVRDLREMLSCYSELDNIHTDVGPIAGIGRSGGQLFLETGCTEQIATVQNEADELSERLESLKEEIKDVLDLIRNEEDPQKRQEHLDTLLDLTT